MNIQAMSEGFVRIRDGDYVGKWNKRTIEIIDRGGFTRNFNTNVQCLTQKPLDVRINIKNSVALIYT